MALDELVFLNGRLDADAERLRRLRLYRDGDQPLAFLSPGDRDKLKGRLDRLAVNLPRLMVRSVADRLQVTGFTSGMDAEPDLGLWELWRRARMPRRSRLAMEDALTFGRAYLIAWRGVDGRPTITVESPASVMCRHDPATGDVVAAVKRWVSDDGTAAFATVFEPDRITRFRADGNSFDPSSVPVSAWKTINTQDNPLGVVPVVPLIHGAGVSDLSGVSVFEDLIGLTDALSKTAVDAMVTSEAYARPHRFATGIQIATDDAGAAEPMFDLGDDFLLSEDPETRFGQFDPADLRGYAELASVLTGLASAVSGLPPHLIGASTATPPSAESLSVALDSLVGRVRGAQVSFGDGFAQAVAIADTLLHGGEVAERLVDTTWASVEPRSLGASADAASKLLASGVDPAAVMDRALGWSGVEVQREVRNG